MMKTLKTSLTGLAFLMGLCLLSGAAFAWNPQLTGGRCKQQTNKSCRGTIGNAGGQGACCDPQSPNIASCAQNNPCVGGQPQKWASNKLPLSWFLNANNMANTSSFPGASETDIANGLKAAWDAWTKPTCTSFRHRYGGTTTKGTNYQDGLLVMFMATPSQWAQIGAGSSTLAFTAPVAYQSGSRRGEMVDADITFNPRPGGTVWGVKSVARNQMDFKDVAAHEIGHAIGFGHTQFRSSLMYYSARGVGPIFNGLSQDEVSGVCATYKRSGPCTSDSQCAACQRCASGKCVAKNISVGSKTCKPCTNSSSCGGSNSFCIRTEVGNRCLQTCDSKDCCPTGYRCANVGGLQKMCVPDLGKCPTIRCSKASDCGPGEACASGTCRPATVNPAPNACKTCSSNSDCGSGLLCQTVGNKRRCVQPCNQGLFCPQGYGCTDTSSGRYCKPNDDLCPCRSNSDCSSGESCSQGKCQKTGGGTFGDSCSDTIPCAKNYQCLTSQNGKICIQPCGSSASGYPPGSPGGECRANGSCDLGASCYKVSQTQTVCLRPCRGNNDCSFGGRCLQFQGVPQAFCLCQNNGDCRSGQACNTSLFRNAGACANQAAPPTCPAGYKCQAAGGGQFCLPGAGNKGVGDSCGASPTDNCKEGLQCLRTSSATTTGTCIEVCTQSNSCKFGGSCVSAGQNLKVCICSSNAQCPSGTGCRAVGNNIRLCTAGEVKQCGNGLCDGNENCATCAQDCPCRAGASCEKSTGRCRAGKCGDGTCDSAEDCGNCAQDCKCKDGKVCQSNRCVVKGTTDPCGDGTCDTAKGENCTNCQKDCGCKSGNICQGGTCKEAKSCGDGTCDGLKGENCNSCPQDCGCKDGKVCNGASCVDKPKTDGGTGGKLNCPVSEQVQQCDVEGTNCVTVCAGDVPKTGCNCSTQDEFAQNALGFFFLFVFFLFVRIRRRR